MSNMRIDEIAEQAKKQFTVLNSAPVGGVTGFAKVDNGWVVSIEALEKRSIPDGMDILGLYEIHLDNEGNLISMERKKLRKRSDTEKE